MPSCEFSSYTMESSMNSSRAKLNTDVRLPSRSEQALGLQRKCKRKQASLGSGVHNDKESCPPTHGQVPTLTEAGTLSTRGVSFPQHKLLRRRVESWCSWKHSEYSDVC